MPLTFNICTAITGHLKSYSIKGNHNFYDSEIVLHSLSKELELPERIFHLFWYLVSGPWKLFTNLCRAFFFSLSFLFFLSPPFFLLGTLTLTYDDDLKNPEEETFGKKSHKDFFILTCNSR